MASQQVNSYEVKNLLESTDTDFLVDVRGYINETFQSSADDVHHAVKRLEDEYGEDFPETWEIEYTEEDLGVFVSLGKNYNLQGSKELELEIRGTMDIDIEYFSS